MHVNVSCVTSNELNYTRMIFFTQEITGMCIAYK